MTTLDLDRVRGCLLAGAVGDALGGAVEFESLHEIRARYGDGGVGDYDFAYGRLGAITDDTQMTLFTAEALLRSAISGTNRRTELYQAYLRWFITQGEPVRSAPASSWLLRQPKLHACRGPGGTCLSALGTGRAGRTTSAINNSKGCGGVMRAAPAAFVGTEGAFEVGCDLAAITHGHPAGYLSAGVLASTIAHVMAGASLEDAIDAARAELVGWPHHEDTLQALDGGIALGRRGLPTGEEIEQLGGGWVGEEALAIAVACALGASSLEEAIVAAVNHSGDSDSTGAITGNLLGAVTGAGAIPERWLEYLEVRDLIEQLAADSRAVFGADSVITDDIRVRYTSEETR